MAVDTPLRESKSGSGRGDRRGRLLLRFYGSHYSADPLNHSMSRRLTIQKGQGLPSVPELLAGADFYKNDFQADIRRFCSTVLKYERILRRHFLPIEPSVGADAYQFEQLNQLFDTLRQTLTDTVPRPAGRISKHLHNLRHGGNYRLSELAFDCSEFGDRLQFYVACEGNVAAQVSVAQLCFHALAHGQVNGAETRAFRCAIAWLDQSLRRSDGPCKPTFGYLTGSEMIVEGNVILQNLGRVAPAEQLIRMFILEDQDAKDLRAVIDGLQGAVEKDQIKSLRQNGMDLEANSNFLNIENIQRQRSSDAKSPKPALVVFTTMANTTGDLDTIYKPLLGKSLPLLQPPDLVKARQILMAEFPHAGEVIELLLKDAGNRRDQTGQQFIKIKPTVLVGTPGSGKSFFTRRFAEVMGLPLLFFPCAGVRDSMFGSSNKKWGNNAPALPVEKLALEKVANCLVILDEIEKSGTESNNGRLNDVILNMVEPSTAETYFDQCISASVNLSALNWLATANSLSGLSAPLRDRFRVLSFPSPASEHLPILLPAILRTLSRERYGDERWSLPFDQMELEQFVSSWKGGSIRTLERIAEVVLDTRDKFTHNALS